MDMLTCFNRRAVGANDGTGYAHGDGDVEDLDLNLRFEHLRTNATPANVGRSASCPKIATPSRFRLVGLFRSQSSRNWTPPCVDAEEDDGVRDTSRSPVLLKKKKMRVLI
jgi:hypothetical protein